MKNIQNKLFLTAFLSLIITVSFQQTGYSQSVWMQDYKNNATWGVEFLTPGYSLGNNPRGFDFATYLYTNVPFGENWGLKLMFPISRYNGGGAKLGSGNPFVGFHYINRDSGIKFDFGARLPLIQSNNPITESPFIHSPYYRGPSPAVYNVAAFNEIKTAVRYNINYRYGGDAGWIFKIGQGLQAIAPADGGMALLFNYYGQALYRFDNLTLGGILKGYHSANESHYLIPKRNRLYFGLLGRYDLGRVDFGLYLKKKITSFRHDRTGIVLGFSFRVEL